MIVTHSNRNIEHEAFTALLDSSIKILEDETQKKPEYFIKRTGQKLEEDITSILKSSSVGTLFDGKIERISGQRFPDIVAWVNKNKAFGLEVKTTIQNHWTSTGSSIFEGTRVENVERIYLLFGKLFQPIEYKYRRYEECLSNVAITHSPRYLIDMDLNLDETIFSKIGIEYDNLRKLENPFLPIKNYFRKILKDKNEDVWWIDGTGEHTVDLAVRHWTNLTPIQKENFRIEAFVYFPELFGKGQKKYSRLAAWLASRHGVINPSLRDTFTAGGQKLISSQYFPKIFYHLYLNKNTIFNMVENIEQDDISFYWGVSKIKKNKRQTWIDLCLEYAKEQLDQNKLLILKTLLSE